MRISDWSSDVCSSDLLFAPHSRHTIVTDKHGDAFLDRDGDDFRLVLNYLRNLSEDLPFPPLSSDLIDEFSALSIPLPQPVVSTPHLKLDRSTFKDRKSVV